MKSQAEFLMRAVRDTLDSIVNPAVRDSLLAEALTLAQQHEVPDELERFLKFLRGPLARTLERALGHELGRSVVAELERLTESLARESAPESGSGRRVRARARGTSEHPASAPAIGSEQRRSSERPSPRARSASARPAQHSTLPPRRMPTPRLPAAVSPTLPARPQASQPRPPRSNDFPSGTAKTFNLVSSGPPLTAKTFGLASSGPPNTEASQRARKLPVVFVATRDAELVRRFGAWLDPRAAVVRVSRLLDLLLDLHDAGERRTVVVLDGRSPPLRIEALAALSEELPDTLSIVLWGGTRELTARLSDLFPRVSEWLVCTEQTSLADVAERCAELVG